MDAEIEFDHVAMPVGDIERSVEFYHRVLGATPLGLEKWREGRAIAVSISFGRQKFNLHTPDNKITLKAAHPMVGGGDYCFVWPGTVQSAIDHLTRLGVPIGRGACDAHRRTRQRGERLFPRSRRQSARTYQLRRTRLPQAG